MKIEFLTDELYKKFDGEEPPFPLKGVAMTEGDEVFGVCGTSLIEGQNFIILALTKEANRRLMVEGWKLFQDMLDDEKTYYALIDKTLPTAEGLLNHFKFEPFKDDIYIYRG